MGEGIWSAGSPLEQTNFPGNRRGVLQTDLDDLNSLE